MSDTAAPRFSYQPALDGLRALAVVSVILFHNGVSWMPGGFLGVDIFFVLSGYLITTLLLLEFVSDPPGIELKAFWLRRARRLLPALLLVLIGVAAYARFAAEPITIHSLRWDGLASLFYVANWRFIFSHQSYFEHGAAPSPLRHLWSLAVEEQWYLLWPIFVTIALKRSVRRKSLKPMLAVMAGLCLASTALMYLLTLGSGDPSRAYYGTDTRAATLLVGACLAVALRIWPIRTQRVRVAAQVAGALSLAGVVAFLVRVHDGDRWMYHGGFLLLAVLTALVIAAAMMPTPGLVKRVLAVPVFPAIGRISYGLYLWHWPVNVWLNPSRVDLPDFQLIALRVGVTVVISLLSYKFVELPVRHGVIGRFAAKARERWRTKASVPAIITATSFLVTAGLLLGATANAPASAARSPLIPAGAAGHPVGVPKDSRNKAPLTTVDVPIDDKGPIPAAPPGQLVQVEMAGDSVAWTLSWAVDTRPLGVQVADRAIIGCGVVDTDYYIHSTLEKLMDSCHGWQDYWQQGAAQKPNVVAIMIGAWEVYDHQINGQRVKPGDPRYEAIITNELEGAVAKVLAVSPDSRLAFVQMACLQERDDRLGGPTSERNDPSRLQWVNKVVARIAAHYGRRAGLFDMGELLCPGGKFKKTIDGVEMRPDGSHFNEKSAAIAWKWLAPRLLVFARRPLP